MAKGLKLTNRRCECPTCGQCFNSVAAFDRHRVKTHAPRDKEGRRESKAARRCLDTLEMRACGMVENRAGYWVSAENMHWKWRTDDA